MKYIKHHLGEVNCPLNRAYRCSNKCAWFDNEDEDCRMIGGFWKVREGLNEVTNGLRSINKNIFDGFDALFQKT